MPELALWVTSVKAKEVSNLTVGVSYVCMMVRALWPLHAPYVLLMYARLYVLAVKR